jgi:hypothetical protein
MAHALGSVAISARPSQRQIGCEVSVRGYLLGSTSSRRGRPVVERVLGRGEGVGHGFAVAQGKDAQRIAGGSGLADDEAVQAEAWGSAVEVELEGVRGGAFDLFPLGVLSEPALELEHVSLRAGQHDGDEIGRVLVTRQDSGKGQSDEGQKSGFQSGLPSGMCFTQDMTRIPLSRLPGAVGHQAALSRGQDGVDCGWVSRAGGDTTHRFPPCRRRRASRSPRP